MFFLRFSKISVWFVRFVAWQKCFNAIVRGELSVNTFQFFRTMSLNILSSVAPLEYIFLFHEKHQLYGISVWYSIFHFLDRKLIEHSTLKYELCVCVRKKEYKASIDLSSAWIRLKTMRAFTFIKKPLIVINSPRNCLLQFIHCSSYWWLQKWWCCVNVCATNISNWK